MIRFAFIFILFAFFPLFSAELGSGQKHVNLLIKEYREGKWDTILSSIDEDVQTGLNKKGSNPIKMSSREIEENRELYEDFSALFETTSASFIADIEEARSKRDAQYKKLQHENPEAEIHRHVKDWLAREKEVDHALFSPEIACAKQSFHFSFWPPLFDESDDAKRKEISQHLRQARGRATAVRLPGDADLTKEQHYRELLQIIRIHLYEKMLASYPAKTNKKMHQAVRKAYETGRAKMAYEWNYFVLKQIAQDEKASDYDRRIANLFLEHAKEVCKKSKEHQILFFKECSAKSKP